MNEDQILDKASVSRRYIDFEYYKQRAGLLRNKAIRDLVMAVAAAFVNASRPGGVPASKNHFSHS